MELRIIYEHEHMRDMVVHVNSDGMQKIMQILMDDNNIIVTQLTPRAADALESCENNHHYIKGDDPSICSCGKPVRR